MPRDHRPLRPDAPAPGRGAIRSPSLIGSWELRTDQGSLGFTFAADGSGSLNGVPLRWAFEDGTLSITMGPSTTAYQASFIATTLTLSGGDLAQTIELERVGAPKPADTEIVGKWRAANGAVFEFKPDGSGSNARGAFRYTASGGVLMFMSTEGSRLMQYRVEGKRLIVAADGDSAALTRAAEGTSVQARAAAPKGVRNVAGPGVSSVDRPSASFRPDSTSVARSGRMHRAAAPASSSTAANFIRSMSQASRRSPRSFRAATGWMRAAIAATRETPRRS